ncbi:homeobox-like domain superfamily [Holotrichia oblita]|uniref:Homeobox-like domain superfamily n=1 Tax=Holotrichia oblita TaxID=644536 RepID=A0ACB9SYL8_HOLOL|nr:homeobox-like domain superfamily [Holotrichia oblita]
MPRVRRRDNFRQLSAFERGTIVGMREAGMALWVIANRLGRNASTVLKCWRSWTEEQKQQTGRGSGAVRRTNDREERFLRINAFRDRFSTSRSLNRRLQDKSGSFDSDKEAVTFSWTVNRSDIQLTMAPKTDYENIQPNTKLVAVHVTSLPPTKLNKFLQLFQCLAKKTLDDSNKRLSNYYSPSPTFQNGDTKSVIELEHTPSRFDSNSLTSGEISNSSLKNVDRALLEEELGIRINTTGKQV